MARTPGTAGLPRRLEGDTTGGQDAHTTKRTPINAGYWRYHPVRHSFEVFAHGTSNPWGFDYNENGRIDFADVVWLFNNL